MNNDDMIHELEPYMPETHDADELADPLDWAGYDFEALPVQLREGYWADCDFTGAKARNTKWNLAYLRDANFTNADLRGADFYGAYMTGVDFTGADLTGASFEMATLVDAKFGKCAALPAPAAFHTAYVGRRTRERLIARTGLPAGIVDLAVQSSDEFSARCEALGTTPQYMRADPALSDAVDKE
jgi:hypothetical protein